MSQRGPKSRYHALADDIILGVGTGAPLSVVAAAAGVNGATIRNWLRHKPEFRDAVKAAHRAVRSRQKRHLEAIFSPNEAA